MIRVELPYHLQTLAGVDGEVALAVDDPVTLGAVLDALEARFPMLCGTIRDHVTRRRRPMVRFYADERDLSNQDPEVPLSKSVATGDQPLLIIGAIAGG